MGAYLERSCRVFLECIDEESLEKKKEELKAPPFLYGAAIVLVALPACFVLVVWPAPLCGAKSERICLEAELS